MHAAYRNPRHFGNGNDRGFVAGAAQCPANGNLTVAKVRQLPDMFRMQHLDLSIIHYQFSIISSVAVLELGFLTALYHFLRGSALLGGHFGGNCISLFCRRISGSAV